MVHGQTSTQRTAQNSLPSNSTSECIFILNRQEYRYTLSSAKENALHIKSDYFYCYCSPTYLIICFQIHALSPFIVLNSTERLREFVDVYKKQCSAKAAKIEELSKLANNLLDKFSVC